MSSFLKKKVVLKLVILGDSGVGKSSLLLRYVSDTFSLATKSTIGTQFLEKRLKIEEKDVTLQVWDTAGQERYQGLGTAFYRGSDGVLFVFDVTRRETFENLDAWRKAFLIQTNQEDNEKFPTIILANKVDMVDERVVSYDEAKAWCDEHNLELFEVSAKENQDVDQAFETISELVIDQMDPDDIKLDTEVLSVDKKGGQEDGGCC